MTFDNLTPAQRAKRKYYERNKELCKARARAHRNSDAGRAWMREWQNSRKSNNPQFKLRQAMATRVWWALHRAGANKTADTLSLLGVNSVDEVWARLEAQFKPGMTRDNYGTYWEIDHAEPCAKFDLTDPEQQRACFHFSNLQPLTVEENRSKGAK